MKSDIIFADERLESSFHSLKNLKFEDKLLYGRLTKAFEKLEMDAFSGVQVHKRQIPKDYEAKFGNVDNLWKYNLPKGWRLLYTIKKQGDMVITVILEWLPHGGYEKRFNY